MFQLVSGEELDARLRPSVEAFEQRDADVVAQIGVAHAVVDGVGLEAVVVVEVVVCRRAVGCVCAAVVVEAYSVEEGRDGDVLVFHELVFFRLCSIGGDAVACLLFGDGDACGGGVGGCGGVRRLVARYRCAVGSACGCGGSVAVCRASSAVSAAVVAFAVESGFLLCLAFTLLLLCCDGKFLCLAFLLRHGHLAVEADAVAVCEEDVLVVVAVPVVREDGGNLVLHEVVFERFGVCDVFVVSDATVLRLFLMVGAEEEVCLVAVAEIAAPEGVVEVRRALVGVVSAGVEVVELESEAELS